MASFFLGVTNVLAGYFLKLSLNAFWGSVNSVQIVAHLPLNNFVLPASCYETFSSLITITSFDFIEPAEHIDLNITETEPHNPKFD